MYKMYNLTVSSMARFTPSHAAQRTLHSHNPEAHLDLAANRNLARDVWFTMARKSKADIAYELINRELDIEQLRVFAADKRVTVRRNLVANGMRNCTDEMAELLLSQVWFDSESAGTWLTAATVPVAMRKRVGLIENGTWLVRLMAEPGLFSDEEIAELLPNVNLNTSGGHLHRLFDLRPALVALGVKNAATNHRLGEAAAGSQHLFERDQISSLIETIERHGGHNYRGNEIMLTLMANPNLPLDILEGLVGRFPSSLLNRGSSLRNGNGQMILNAARIRVARQIPALDRPWDMQDESHRERVQATYELLSSTRYPTLQVRSSIIRASVPGAINGKTSPVHEAPVDMTRAIGPTNPLDVRTVCAITEMLDHHGHRAWETFWSLVDTWQGDMGSLVDSCVSLAA